MLQINIDILAKTLFTNLSISPQVKVHSCVEFSYIEQIFVIQTFILNLGVKAIIIRFFVFYFGN